MEDRGVRPAGFSERIRKTFISRDGIDDEGSGRCHARTRIAVMILICVLVGSMIIYWFISSILENRRDGRCKMSSDGKSCKHLERLPDHILPLEYTLKILPVLEEGNFTIIGDVQIQFYSKIPTKHVRLHARKLLVRDISVREYRSSNTSKSINKYVVTDEEDFIDVFLLQALTARETYVLHIKYTTPLHQEPKGLFRSSHVDRDTNETKWIAVSNFSPDYAREAYPCFDEPWIKTPFRISIGRKFNMRSHSNTMRKVTEQINDMPGYVWDNYEKTLAISTYLIAFMVTDFSSYDLNVTDRLSHTIFARKEILNDTRYIGNRLPQLLRLIENFTGFYYEPDKLDLIVVPKMSYSAMENWGLISFREDTAIIKNDASLSEKMSAIRTMAHEIAHQWFGNLVTPKWWNDVWLKEGFSSFYGLLALNALEPATWDLQVVFLQTYDNMFHTEAFKTAHPLHIDLKDLSALVDIFDSTPYVKGNCMAHMIYHFLGERVFLSSVSRYIRTYYYRSADQEDLWSAFQVEIDRANDGLPASSGPYMKDVMRTWTYQAGFPVLRVQQNRETGAIELTQDRFYHYGLNSTSEELWHIPLTWTTENEQQFGNTLPKAWMIKKRMKINDTALSRASSNNQWILFNINQTALYRVNYDVKNWKLLTESFRTLPEVAKVQLLTDSYAITEAGLLDRRIMWNILEKLEYENGETLWMSAITVLCDMWQYLWDSKIFKFVMCRFADEAYKTARSLIYKDPALWTEFQVEAMKWACLMGHRACLTAVSNFAEVLLRNESSVSVPKEFRTWIYCTHVKVATDEQWLALLKRYNESDQDKENSLPFALGCHANANLLQRYLSMMFSQRNIKPEHVRDALLSIMSNSHGYQIAIKFLTRYWDKFAANATEGDNKYANVTLDYTLHAFARRVRQEEDTEWLQRLKGRSEKYDTVIEQVINRALTIVAWNKEHKNEVLNILKEISMRYAETGSCRRERD